MKDRLPNDVSLVLLQQRSAVVSDSDRIVRRKSTCNYNSPVLSNGSACAECEHLFVLQGPQAVAAENVQVFDRTESPRAAGSGRPGSGGSSRPGSGGNPIAESRLASSSSARSLVGRHTCHVVCSIASPLPMQQQRGDSVTGVPRPRDSRLGSG